LATTQLDFSFLYTETPKSAEYTGFFINISLIVTLSANLQGGMYSA